MPESKQVSTTENGSCTNAKPAGESSDGDVVLNSTVMLPAAVLKHMWRSYSIKQRRSGLKLFLFAAMLFEVWSLAIPQEQCLQTLVVTLVVLCLNIVVVVVLHVTYILQKRGNASTRFQRFYDRLLRCSPYVIWLICVTHLALYTSLQQSPSSPRDILGWGILLNFLVYVTLPVPLLHAACIGLATLLIYLATIYLATRRTDPLFNEQLLANLVLTLTSAAIGILFYFLGEKKQKRAFLEARHSLEMKMIIEEQSAEQERLLLSVLPKHVAVKMRQDLGSTSSEPFKKIYMSRHENVSILYADIVGFTAISSTYSAQDLVKMLNELFARFDRLSEKYQQLRIKILGDCYYCISGAPVERPDHAALCVFMGLSMVKAIKYVQQKANSPVDMRVGVHTGAILAGILGQRQWQFDVYSKDVELANKMESSGKAGRVHISDKTLAFLNGEFEVEPAYGERREEALRIAGLKTYFIKKVLKPFASPAGKVNEKQNTDNDHEGDSGQTAHDDDDDDELLTADGAPTNGQSRTPASATDDDTEEALDKQAVFKQRLQEELVVRDGHENLSKDTTLFLKFNERKLEAAYAAYREPFSSIPLVAALLVQCMDVVYSYIVLPRSPLHFINISAPLIPLLMLVVISVAENFPKHLPEFFVCLSKRFNDACVVRELTAIIMALTIGLSNIIDMYFFLTFLKTEHIVSSEAEFNVTTFTTMRFVTEQAPGPPIMYPSYMSNFGVLVLIAIAVIAQLTHVTKIVLMVTIAVLHCCSNVLILIDLYALEDRLALNPKIPTWLCTSAILLVVALALSFFARHLDHEDRVIFKWKIEVAEQKEMATDMRRRNEALVYNILPVHVAEHFMKNTRRSHDDLYSQSYAEVGVLFASMPNFSDFYSEETVNNQGLECLRFLNEVISDFDALLELPQFQDIIKIKTIGSTYMAASGINLNRISLPDDPITKRWAHLAVLVEFALELKKALHGINEQSFNHFVLKLGINHGPITAGVIGARKPHYDIWGNTVNVASRMESTGKAGNIQVTQETCDILEAFGYTFLQRGLVSVKGKGQLMTYYLQGRGATVISNEKVSSPRSNHASGNGVVPTETPATTTNDCASPGKSNCIASATERNDGDNQTNPEDVGIRTPLLDLKSNGAGMGAATSVGDGSCASGQAGGGEAMGEREALIN